MIHELIQNVYAMRKKHKDKMSYKCNLRHKFMQHSNQIMQEKSRELKYLLSSKQKHISYMYFTRRLLKTVTIHSPFPGKI